METEIVSTENVLPSSPTPNHLQTYKISLLDQIVPSMLVPVVLYFQNTSCSTIDVDPSETTQLLKHSLSAILTRFYPLAGRINQDALSIDCSDQGVPSVVAKCKGQKLSNLLEKPDTRLLPCKVKCGYEPVPGSSVTMIQVNYFDCGGIAIGAVFWHRIADAATIGSFMNSWAATARGSRQPVCPNYIAQHLFPQKQELGNQTASLGTLLKTGKSIMKRYVFDALAISELKARTNIQCPTRVEVVSTLLWKCFMVASLANNKSTSLLTHAVNLRRKARPPFPSDCIGNFLAGLAATSSNTSGEDLEQLVTTMRDAMSKIDDRIQGGHEGFMRCYENIQLMWSDDVPEGADPFSMSSWCGLGFYNTDFGWGKPFWISGYEANYDPALPFVNGVWLMDTRLGGVEAWVTLDEKYMRVFEKVEELNLASKCDPSPLSI